jgi:hypothetical protein
VVQKKVAYGIFEICWFFDAFTSVARLPVERRTIELITSELIKHPKWPRFKENLRNLRKKDKG